MNKTTEKDIYKIEYKNKDSSIYFKFDIILSHVVIDCNIKISNDYKDEYYGAIYISIERNEENTVKVAPYFTYASFFIEMNYDGMEGEVRGVREYIINEVERFYSGVPAVECINAYVDKILFLIRSKVREAIKLYEPPKISNLSDESFVILDMPSSEHIDEEKGRSDREKVKKLFSGDYKP